MQKYCTNCGNKLESGSKFCHNCGEKIEQNIIKESQVQSGQEQKLYNNSKSEPNSNSNNVINNSVPMPKYKRHKRKKVKSGCLGTFIVVFIFFAIGIFFSTEETEKFEIGLSDTVTSIETKKGIEVSIPPFIIDENTQLDVTERSLSSEEGVLRLDINLEEHHEFDDFLEVKVPLNHDKLKNVDPTTLQVFSIQPHTGELDVELTDIIDNHLVFYTDHLSEFDIKPISTVAGKIKRANMTNISRESMLKLMNKVRNNEAGEQSTAVLGYEAFNNGLGWSANFHTYADAAARSTDFMKSLGKKMSIIGNTAFYINASRQINNSVETGNYGDLGGFVLNDGIGFVVANLSAIAKLTGSTVLKAYATPVAVAYVSFQVGKFAYVEVNEYIDSVVDAKFDHASKVVHQQYIKDKYPAVNYNMSYFKFKQEIKDRIMNFTLNASSEENLNYAIDQILENVAREQLTKDYQKLFIQAAKDYQGNTSDDGYMESLVKWFADEPVQNSEELMEKYIKKRKEQLYRDLQVVFYLVSKNMLTKTEKGYYQAFYKIADEVETPFKIKWTIKGPLPKNVEWKTIEWVDGQGNVLERVLMEDSYIMSFSDYMKLGLPRQVRLSLEGKGATEVIDVLEKPFQFRMKDQEIVFSTINPETPFIIDFRVDGTYKKEMQGAKIVYYANDSKTITRELPLGTDKVVKDAFNYKQYEEFGSPNKVALIMENGDELETIEKDFSFEAENQTITFTLEELYPLNIKINGEYPKEMKKAEIVYYSYENEKEIKKISIGKSKNTEHVLTHEESRAIDTVILVVYHGDTYSSYEKPYTYGKSHITFTLEEIPEEKEDEEQKQDKTSETFDELLKKIVARMHGLDGPNYTFEEFKSEYINETPLMGYGTDLINNRDALIAYLDTVSVWYEASQFMDIIDEYFGATTDVDNGTEQYYDDWRDGK